MAIKLNRREFMKLIGWLSSVLISSTSFGDNKHMFMQSHVPKRAFGNSGVKISKLCLGGASFGGSDSEALLDEALKYGIDCWEIVSFTGKAYSEYFNKHPEIRKKIFLTGKVFSANPVIMQEQLNKLLEDNGTTYVDFLAIHQIDNIRMLNNDVKKWVDKVKKKKRFVFLDFAPIETWMPVSATPPVSAG